jgi:ubiquitin carboxyl-terminal hydrolase 5/13
MLGAMGFAEDRAKYALSQTGNDLERAAEWLFSHEGEDIPQQEASGSGNAAAAAPAATTQAVDALASATSSTYTLVGFLSHMGTSTSGGHYVAHIRKTPQGTLAGPETPDARWYIYNDAKVAISQDPPLDLGYVYLYKRDE